MWRSFFLAAGLSVLLLGVECLGVEKFVLRLKGDPPPPVSPFDTETKAAPAITYSPLPWVPYSLMSTGAITCIYSFTLPRRLGG